MTTRAEAKKAWLDAWLRTNKDQLKAKAVARKSNAPAQPTCTKIEKWVSFEYRRTHYTGKLINTWQGFYLVAFPNRVALVRVPMDICEVSEVSR